MPTQTGFVKPYGTYLYGPYKPNDDLFHFEPEPLNPALPNKHPYIYFNDNKQSRVFKFSNFNGDKVLRENIFNKNHLTISNENIIVLFKPNTSANNSTFTYYFNNSKTFFRIMKEIIGTCLETL